MNPAPDFSGRARTALADDRLRANFRRAMDGLMAKRAAAFPDAEARERLRDQGAEVRSRALAKLPELLEQLEARCTGNGMRVHWAETPADANRIVLEILQRAGARRLVKGKSMVTEETELNHFLEAAGIECVESDLGEYIVQLAHETPSHIIMPAIHKNRPEIAALFREHLPQPPDDDAVEGLTAAARRTLRALFEGADAGISGVNFAIAETGTLCLVENEGNGRLSTTAPRVHIAVTGIEKVIERMEDVAPLLALLPRSATGQPITTYVNFISSPRRPGERDGPAEVHLVLLDNGRSRIHADPELRATLRCIRCGACINHCPVYARIGGHAYGTTYPGPIGKILMPQIGGIDKLGQLARASTLCGACGEVCPVRIPIPDLLVTLRRESVAKGPSASPAPIPGRGALRTAAEALAWRVWSGLATRPRLYRAAVALAGRLRALVPQRLGPLGRWRRARGPLRPAPRSLHELARAKGLSDE